MKILTRRESGRLTLYLTGDLDHHAARGALKSLDELIASELPRTCCLNLAELRFMDSSGIALILKLRKLMSGMGGELQIENVPTQARRVLEAAGLDKIVGISLDAKEKLG